MPLEYRLCRSDANVASSGEQPRPEWILVGRGSSSEASGGPDAHTGSRDTKRRVYSAFPNACFVAASAVVEAVVSDRRRHFLYR